MYGGTKLTDFLIETNNKKLTPDQEKELDKYLNDNSLINQPNEEGLTPLHILCSLETLNPHMIKKLIKMRARVNVESKEVNAETKEEYRDTPLDILMIRDYNDWKSEEFKEIMTLLLKRYGIYDKKKINERKLKYINNIQDKIHDEEVASVNEERRLIREKNARLDKERLEQESIAKAKADRLEKERLNQERTAKAKAATAKAKADRLENERLKQESIAKAKAATAKAKADRLEKERLKQERTVKVEDATLNPLHDE